MSRPSVRIAVLAAVVSQAVGVAHAGSIAASAARIVEVTVFRDRAEVVREANVELPEGASSIEFGDIPTGVEPDSLRVSASGVPATLGAVTLAERVAEAHETSEFVSARDEVRRLQDALTAIDSDRRVDQELQRFLASVATVTATVESTKLGEGRADPESIAGLYDVLQGKHTELASRALEQERKRRQISEDLELARARLAVASPGSGIRSRVASVEIESERRGSVTVRLAYVAPGATWRPTYRAALDADTGVVHLVAEGVVVQHTGEDWSEVRLRLSTASPAAGAAPPVLTSWFVRPGAPLFTDEFIAGLPVAGRYYQNVLALAPGVQDASGDGPVSQPTVVAPSRESEIVRSAYNVEFEVVGRSDVPTDARDHRVVLRSEDLSGKLVHRIVPAADPRAYLSSVTTSPEGYPLLAGAVRVFAGGAYLGSFGVEETGPGTEWTVPFGVDNRVEVVRVPLHREAGREGGKQRTLDLAYKTTLTNRLDRATTVILEDRIPVSEDDRIVIELDKTTTAGWKPSERRPGVMLWTLDLERGEKRDIVLAYSVRAPRDLVVPGLD